MLLNVAGIHVNSGRSATARHVAPPSQGKPLHGRVCGTRKIRAGSGRPKDHRGTRQSLD